MNTKYTCPPAPPPLPPSPPSVENENVELCLPVENDVTHCWGESCYYYFAAATYASAAAACANMSAIVFSPNTQDEQLEVESYFKVQGMLDCGSVAFWAQGCQQACLDVTAMSLKVLANSRRPQRPCQRTGLVWGGRATGAAPPC